MLETAFVIFTTVPEQSTPACPSGPHAPRGGGIDKKAKAYQLISVRVNLKSSVSHLSSFLGVCRN